LKVDLVEFVRSATGAGDLPGAGVAELALVGRSNVGKSSLINALFKRPVARTSAAPGKTRLLNLYRVVTRATGEFYLVDLPGYGYAKKEARGEFDRLAAAYFGRAVEPSERPGVRASGRRAFGRSDVPTFGREHRPSPIGVLLALDARHPGMENDLATLQWLRDRRFDSLVVVNKIDKVSGSQRARALDRFGELFGEPVLPVSAATGEGMEELWKQIVSWVVSTTIKGSRRSERAATVPPAPRRP
jgi:GTP-binding protein